MTRLYANLTQEARFMAFFDVKNAKLVDRRDDESIVQREPLVDMDQFGSFCTIANNLMQPHRDLAWILLGKCESAYPTIKKNITELGWKEKLFIWSTHGGSSRSGM